MNVAIYARYSSAAQGEQSIEGQVAACVAFAESQGHTVVREYIDRALSGKTDNRPAFLRMISDSARHQFSAVLVYQLDRFARNRFDSATYRAKLKKNNVRLLSARENITEDASGILMEALLEGMAEYYSVELSQKVRRGMALNAKKGLSTGGIPTLGYKTVAKRVVIHEKNAEVVRFIFSQYLMGKTIAELQRTLVEMQVTTPFGNPYKIDGIQRILANRRYCGTLLYGEIEVPNAIPAIIDKNAFERANKLLQSSRKAPSRTKLSGEHYVLSSKLYCGHCDGKMTGISGTSHTQKIYQYYACVTQRIIKTCTKCAIPKQVLEDVVVQSVTVLMDMYTEELLKKKILLLSTNEDSNYRLKHLKQSLERNEKAIQSLIEALECGEGISTITTQLKYREQEHKELTSEIALEEEVIPHGLLESVRLFFSALSAGAMDEDTRKQSLLDIFVSTIHCFDMDIDGYLEVGLIFEENSLHIPIHYKKKKTSNSRRK